MDKKTKLWPGSDVARRAGCICSVRANNYGDGITRDNGKPVSQRRFDISAFCPVHAPGWKP